MKRLFAIILSVAIMIPMGVLVISAEDIVQKNEVIEPAPSADFISRSAAARECDNSIREHLEAVDDELRRHFSGSYLDSSGDLVILLSCDTSACKEQIIAETGYMDAIFKEGNGSYYDTMAALEAINHRIYTSQETVRTGTADAATVAMMKMYPLPEYDAYTNAITLVLDVAPELLPYIMGSGQRREPYRRPDPAGAAALGRAVCKECFPAVRQDHRNRTACDLLPSSSGHRL